MTGRPEKSGVISELVTASDAVAVLLARLLSLLAPVEPFNVTVPATAGVPETVHVILPPAATVAGGAGAHKVVKPAGSPLTAQVADVAATAGEAALEHVYVPL